MGSITFRACTSGDVEKAVPLIFNSGPDAYRYVFSESTENQALEFLTETFIKPGSEFGYQQHVAVLLNEEMVGIGGVRYAEQNSALLLYALRAIFSFYSVIVGLKVSLRGHAIEKVIKPPQPKMGYLYHLSIDPAFQGKGLGSALIEYLISEVKREGFNRVGLDVSIRNTQAKTLYTRYGFEEKNLRPSELHGKFSDVADHIFMVKPI